MYNDRTQHNKPATGIYTGAYSSSNCWRNSNDDGIIQKTAIPLNGRSALSEAIKASASKLVELSGGENFLAASTILKGMQTLGYESLGDSDTDLIEDSLGRHGLHLPWIYLNAKHYALSFADQPDEEKARFQKALDAITSERPNAIVIEGEK